ncbi:profilin-4-like isoform X1 [Convolutriloba macropyga]|uniref:profilin-4-like isoform X1 n=1 Tax=Convolutriloba macropyga TaxID=536237 RepID=UPI003F51B538
MEDLKTLTDFIPFAIKPLHLQVIDRLQKISHVEDCALLDAKSGNIVSANKALAIRLSEEEAKQLVSELRNPNTARSRCTLQFLGHNYDVLRADAYSLYCQTVITLPPTQSCTPPSTLPPSILLLLAIWTLTKQESKDGLILVNGEEYITVVTYNSSMSASISVEAAEKMGNYFVTAER